MTITAAPPFIASISLARVIRLLEYFLFATSVATCLFLLLKYTYFMSTTSLWGDEYASVHDYAQMGVLHAWTDYTKPNNHILYNMINSAWPSHVAYHPVPARLISLVSAYLAFGILFFFSVRSGALATGALCALLLATNLSNLDLILQARGYGLLFLCAIIQSITSVLYLREPSKKWLVISTIAGIVGAATIPLYVVFTAFLFVGLFALSLKRDVVFASLAAVVIGIAFYYPTIPQILHNAEIYDSRWGSDYVNFRAVLRTASYFLPQREVGFYIIFLFLFFFSYNLYFKNRSSTRESILLLLTILFFILACRILETPLIRTTQFLSGPLAILFIASSIPALSSTTAASSVVKAILVVASLPFVYSGINDVYARKLLPIEANIAAAVTADYVRPGASVVLYGHPTVFPTYLVPVFSNYLENPDRLDDLDEKEYRAGNQVYVEGNMVSEAKFKGTRITPSAIDLHIPLRRSKYQVVSFAPKKTEAIRSVLVKGQKDESQGVILDSVSGSGWAPKMGLDDNAKPVRIEFDLDPSRPCDRFFIFTGSDDQGRPDREKVFTYQNGKRSAIDDARLRWLAGLLVVDLSGQSPEKLMLKIGPAEPNTHFSIKEAWCEAIASD